MITARLKSIRNETGKTQQEFAEVIGISRSTYIRYEKGESDIPASLLSTIAEMGYSIDWLLTGRGDMLIKTKDDEITQLRTELKKIDERLEELDANRPGRTNPSLDPG